MTELDLFFVGETSRTYKCCHHSLTRETRPYKGFTAKVMKVFSVYKSKIVSGDIRIPGHCTVFIENSEVEKLGLDP